MYLVFFFLSCYMTRTKTHRILGIEMHFLKLFDIFSFNNSNFLCLTLVFTLTSITLKTALMKTKTAHKTPILNREISFKKCSKLNSKTEVKRKSK